MGAEVNKAGADQAVFVLAGDQLAGMMLEKRHSALTANKVAEGKGDRLGAAYHKGVADAHTSVLRAIKGAREDWEGMGCPSAFEAAIGEAQAMVARAWGVIGFVTWAGRLRCDADLDCPTCEGLVTPLDWALRVRPDGSAPDPFERVLDAFVPPPLPRGGYVPK